MCAMIHEHLWVCVHGGVYGPAAYLRLVMLWSVASDSPASPWPPVIQNMPSQPSSYMKGKGQPTGAYRAGVWWLKLIFITQVPGACAWESMCAFKPVKAWAEQKNAVSRIICMTPPVLWNFKELQRPACLCLPQGIGTREFFFHSACSSRCALKGGKMWEVWFPQCFKEACICPDIARLCTPRRPASLQPPVLMHYRSSMHHGKCLAKAACYFPPMAYFYTRLSVTCNTWRVQRNFSPNW